MRSRYYRSCRLAQRPASKLVAIVNVRRAFMEKSPARHVGFEIGYQPPIHYLRRS
jgi:hypothetical protein